MFPRQGVPDDDLDHVDDEEMLRQADRQYYYRDYKVNIFQPIAPTHSVQTAIQRSNLNLTFSTGSHTHSYTTDEYITHTHSKYF